MASSACDPFLISRQTFAEVHRILKHGGALIVVYAHKTTLGWATPGCGWVRKEQVSKLRGIESGCRQAEAFIRLIQSPDFPLPEAS